MNNIQKQQISLLNGFETSKEVVIKLKPYIKPFERYLAKAEFDGLTSNNGSLRRPFSNPANIEIKCPPSVSLEFLEQRLAYWEKIGTWEFKPTFQVLLESEKGSDAFNGDFPFDFHRSRKLRYGPHGIHEYRGKFFPQLVKSLINFTGLSQGSLVIDPMCGSGTTTCEARSLGMRAIGIDLNPLSVLISDVKTSVFDFDANIFKEEINEILNVVKHPVKKALCPWEDDEKDYLLRWFSPIALDELAIILKSIHKCNNIKTREFAFVCLSNIIRTVSWQKDSDLRVRKEIKKYNEGMTSVLFEREMIRNYEKITNYKQCFNGDHEFYDFLIKEGDSRNAQKILPEWTGKCDLLITSPPYAMALPYIDTDRLSLVVLGLLPRKKHRVREFLMIGNREVTDKQREQLWSLYINRRKELPKTVTSLIEKIAIVNKKDTVGFRRRNLPALLGKYFIDMTDAMRNARELMKMNKYAFYVVGNNSTFLNGRRTPIMTNEFLWEIGKKVGWQQKKVIKMDLLRWDVFSHNNGTAESILWFQK